MLLNLYNLSRFKKNLILIINDIFLSIISFFLAFYLRLEYFLINDLNNQILALLSCLFIFFINIFFF